MYLAFSPRSGAHRHSLAFSKGLGRLLVMSALLTGAACGPSFAATISETYNGNGGNGFGGPLGTGSLTVSQDQTSGDTTFTFNPGVTFSGNAVVVYIDSRPGGFTDTSQFTDTEDPTRTAISGVGGNGRTVATFPSGFAADYAITFEANSMMRLYELDATQHVFLKEQVPQGVHSFTVPAQSLDIPKGLSFKLVASLISTSAYRSNETVGSSTTVPGTVGDTPNAGFNGSVTFNSSNTFNENHPPVITSNGGGASANVDVPENSTAVTTVQASESDAGQTVRYQIFGGADADRFTIDENTGVLQFSQAPDYEIPFDANNDNVYEVTVQAVDSGTFFESDSQDITVNVTDVSNVAPSDLSLSRNQVQEKLPSGTFVGAFSSVDEDSADTFTYSLVTGAGDTDNSQFAIDGDKLRTAASFDTAVKSSYSIRVRSTDTNNLFTEKTFTITVLETTKPTVTIGSPTVNQKVLAANFTGDVLSGSAADNVGVTGVKVRLGRKRGTTNEYWNGTAFGTLPVYLNATVNPVTVEGVDSSNVTWTLAGQLPPADKLDNGAYGLQVYALDAAANKSAYASTTFSVTTDQTAPTLVIGTPTANQKVLISGFNVGGTASDDTGVTAIKVRLSRKRGTTNFYWNGTDFVAASSYLDATVTGSTWSLGSKTPPAGKLDSGAYLVEAYALDAANNKSIVAKVAFTLNNDFTAPSVAITSPTSSQVIKINEFGAGVITGTAADNIGVTGVKLKLQRKRGTEYQYWNGTAFTATSVLFDATYNSETGTWSYDTAIPASALDAGGYTLYATAYDAAGNKTTSASRQFSIVGTPSATGAVSAADTSAGHS